MLNVINYEGWELFSERFISSCYISKDKKRMLKVYGPISKVDPNALLKEKELSDEVYRLGIPTPRTLEVVQVENSYGVIYEYVENKVSIARAICNDYLNKDFYLRKFAELGDRIHSTQANIGMFPNIKDKIFEGLDKVTFFDEKEKENIRDLVNGVPEKYTCLLRDFQFSNVLLDKDSNPFLIDLGTMSYGNPIFDLAFLYYFTHHIERMVIANILHLTYDQARECWDSFIRMVYPQYDDYEINELNEKLSKLSLVTMLSQVTTNDIADLLEVVKYEKFRDTYK